MKNHRSRTISGFSLVEILVVMAIFGILVGVTLPAFNNIGKAGSLTKAGADVASLLEQARTYAMANNTYVWVGFHPEDNESKIAIAVVASRNGGASLTNTDASSASSGLVQLGSIRNLGGVKVSTVPPTPGRPESDPAGRLGAGSNAIISFSTKSGGKNRAFNTYVLQFNSRGEARITTNNLSRVIEIGLTESSGSTNNFAVVQLGGLSGGVTVFRP